MNMNEINIEIGNGRDIVRKAKESKVKLIKF